MDCQYGAREEINNIRIIKKIILNLILIKKLNGLALLKLYLIFNQRLAPAILGGHYRVIFNRTRNVYMQTQFDQATQWSNMINVSYFP